MKEFKDLNKYEKDIVLYYYDKEEDDEIEEFYQDNFTFCENCGEITHYDDISDNDFITSGGESCICETCINDGWGE